MIDHLKSAKETLRSFIRNNQGDDIEAIHDALSHLDRFLPEPKITSTKVIVGAHAYATIESMGRRTNIRLSAGKAPAASLIQYADELEADAMKSLERAALARAASRSFISQPASDKGL